MLAYLICEATWRSSHQVTTCWLSSIYMTLDFLDFLIWFGIMAWEVQVTMHIVHDTRDIISVSVANLSFQSQLWFSWVQSWLELSNLGYVLCKKVRAWIKRLCWVALTLFPFVAFRATSHSNELLPSSPKLPLVPDYISLSSMAVPQSSLLMLVIAVLCVVLDMVVDGGADSTVLSESAYAWGCNLDSFSFCMCGVHCLTLVITCALWLGLLGNNHIMLTKNKVDSVSSSSMAFSTERDWPAIVFPDMFKFTHVCLRLQYPMDLGSSRCQLFQTQMMSLCGSKELTQSKPTARLFELPSAGSVWCSTVIHTVIQVTFVWFPAFSTNLCFQLNKPMYLLGQQQMQPHPWLSLAEQGKHPS